MRSLIPSHVTHLRRPPKADTRVLLFTLAGGRCEFDNCNRYLLQHHVTHRGGIFSQMAHIVAFRPSGPRGESGLSSAERSDISNLMLLCPICHKLIDDNPELYPVETLRDFKRDHEARIHMLTEAKADKQTVPLVLRATIGDSPVAVPVSDIQAAVAPFYTDPRDVDDIDLTAGVESRTGPYWQAGSDAIRERVLRFYERLRQTDRTNISVFALAPIPFLVFLGTCLSNKYPTAIFQRHRDTDDWRWKQDEEPVDYDCRVVTNGSDVTKVALVLSLSGSIPPSDYAGQVDGTFTVYEITPRNVAPSFDHMRAKESLEAFRSRYRDTLQRIVSTHEGAREIHVLPALPAPAAVAVGLDWMRKTHPALVVYDKLGAAGFEKALEIRDLGTRGNSDGV